MSNDSLDVLVNARSQVVGVRLNLAERSLLDSAAAALGLPLASFVRRAAVAAAKRGLKPPAVELDEGGDLPLDGRTDTED